MSDQSLGSVGKQASRLSVGVVTAAIAALLAVSGAWFQARSDISSLRKDLDKVQEQANTADDWRESVNQKLERISTQNEYISEQIKELRERRVNP